MDDKFYIITYLTSDTPYDNPFKKIYEFKNITDINDPHLTINIENYT